MRRWNSATFALHVLAAALLAGCQTTETTGSIGAQTAQASVPEPPKAAEQAKPTPAAKPSERSKPAAEKPAAKPPESDEPEEPMTRARAARECWMKTEKGSAGANLDKRADAVNKCIDEKLAAAPKT